MGLAPRVTVLPSKTRPKRIDMLGSDGASYRFLLKGGEDLHQEQRVQQLLSLINACIQSYTHTPPPIHAAQSLAAAKNTNSPSTPSSRHLAGGKLNAESIMFPSLNVTAVSPMEGIETQSSGEMKVQRVTGVSRASILEAREARVETLNVTPLGHSMGLVQWVPSSVTLYDSFKGWQMRMLARYTATDKSTTSQPAAAAATPSDQGRNGKQDGKVNVLERPTDTVARAGQGRGDKSGRGDVGDKSTEAARGEKGGRGKRGGGRGGGRGGAHTEAKIVAPVVTAPSALDFPELATGKKLLEAGSTKANTRREVRALHSCAYVLLSVFESSEQSVVLCWHEILFLLEYEVLSRSS